MSIEPNTVLLIVIALLFRTSGKLPLKMFDDFDSNITRVVNEIVTMVGASEGIKMQPRPRYFVVCDILTSIRELEKKQMLNENRYRIVPMKTR